MERPDQQVISNFKAIIFTLVDVRLRSRSYLIIIATLYLRFQRFKKLLSLPPISITIGEKPGKLIHFFQISLIISGQKSTLLQSGNKEHTINTSPLKKLPRIFINPVLIPCSICYRVKLGSKLNYLTSEPNFHQRKLMTVEQVISA